ncbi:hypothetical protein [uncultured Maribacter sp.]|uniref:hypothetical protein n=1 Tax=uncultured Maribacter sp. TaxID=431308 RepID=UPI00261599CE|nr:hypothetical protein [uncultured Maribacter sp.]
MKKVASILAVALFTLGMFATAFVSTQEEDFTNITNALANDVGDDQREGRDG